MNKLLVPCDFSETSLEAFKTAIELADKINDEVIVFHSIYIPAYYDPMMGSDLLLNNSLLTTQLEEDAQKRFKEWTKYNTRQVSLQLKICWGPIPFTITQTIDDMNIDLVVMGTSGASGLSEFFIGSNTEKVVRHSKVPVLAIHKMIDRYSVKNILVPSTLSLDQTNFIKKLKEVQRFFHAHIHLLYINTPDHFKSDSDVTGMMEEFVGKYNLKDFTFHLKNSTTEERGIEDFINKQQTDLIAMGTHARKGIARLFNSSITEEVVNHLNAPVWTCRLK